MKKILALFIALCLCIEYIIPLYNAGASDEPEYFIVTAYYSPLPDQEYYITGNYEDEIILNGRGIAGASGKKVFSGMLAAPKKYSFGTKIQLEGLGIGAVEDRGGAIVPAGQRGYSYDRIDVWVGYGDEGLRRALYWGKRKVKGNIVSSYSTTNLDYTSMPAPTWATQNLKKQSLTQNTANIFDISLGKGSDTFRVQELQEVLVQLGYLANDSYTQGEYDSHTIDAIFQIQLETQILENSYDLGAGSYGPKTRKELKILYDEFLQEEQRKQDFLVKYKEIQDNSLALAEQYIDSMGTPVYGEISPGVRELQKTLAKLGYFTYRDTAIYGVKTQEALIEYQRSHNLISSNNDLGSGIFGPKTRLHLIEDISQLYIEDSLLSQNLEEDYKVYLGQTEEITPEVKVSLQDLSISI